MRFGAFGAIWWQLFVGRQTRYICNFAIKSEPNCQYYGTNTAQGPTTIQQCKNLYYTRPIITIVTIVIIFIYVTSTYLEIWDIWRPGAGLAGTRDSIAQIRDIPGNPGRVATLAGSGVFTPRSQGPSLCNKAKCIT